MSASSFQTVNPATEEQMESFDFFSPQQTEKVLQRADLDFTSFRKLAVEERAGLIGRLAAVLRANKASLAAVITREMGKPIVEAEGEVEKCAVEADWYAEHGPAMLADERAPTSEMEAYVSYLPLGPILGIMPWNFPFWQMTRMGIPALLAGNVLLIKHSPNSQRSSLELERMFREAGFPEGACQNLILKTDDIVNVINDGRIAGASVTGSVRAGSAVASEAGKVVKKTVMELGGSDAFIVLGDADIPKAVAAGIKGRFSNAGQICLAPKRFFLVEEIADAFEEQFVAAAQALKVGDPTDRSVQMGPIARMDLREGLDKQVQGSIAAGAQVLCGGKPREGRGAFYEPTVLAGVKPGMPAFEGRNVRPRGGADAGARRGGGGGAGEPKPIRSERERVDARCRQSPQDGP